MRKKFAYIVFILWLLSCAFAFWWFELRFLNEFDDEFVAYSQSQVVRIDPLENGYVAQVVHIVDESCPCSRFSVSHIKRLESGFSEDVLFKDWHTLQKNLREKMSIPASPAVAIWAADGQLAYFGPYSSGKFCGQGNDFVAATIERLRLNDNPEWVNHDALGCFCRWNNTHI